MCQLHLTAYARIATLLCKMLSKHWLRSAESYELLSTLTGSQEAEVNVRGHALPCYKAAVGVELQMVTCEVWMAKWREV